MPLDLSLIIRCCEDERIFRCIDSVDENIEIIASLTPDDYLEKKIKDRGIKYCLSPKGNLSFTTNKAIKLADYNMLIIMDSDSVFAPGTIKKMWQALKENLIVKPKVIFKHNSLTSKLVAKKLDYGYTYKPKAYSPGLGLRKELKERVGGYLYNNKVEWSEDGDLDRRIKKNNIEIRLLNEAIIYHDPKRLRKDIRDSIKCGIGIANGLKEDEEIKKDNLIKYFRKAKKSTRKRVALYLILWKILYYSAYAYSRFHL